MGYREVANLDPLHLDEKIKGLPYRNKIGDVAALREWTYDAVDSLDANSLTKDEATASLRDLDFILSSSIRHGANLVEESGKVEATLIRLGKIACTIPRGTVSTYALANPRGARERSFTGSLEEGLFIESVRLGAEEVEDALRVYVTEGPLEGIKAISRSIDTMVESIVGVKRVITPVYFTNELRPYFDPITIGGKTYAGSGGAQLQFITIDYLVWGADSEDEKYKSYFEDNSRYLSEEQREMLKQGLQISEGNSIVTVLRNQHNPELASATRELLTKLIKFRYPHRKVARDNFALRPDGSIGSGTYTPTILDTLLDHTEGSLKDIKDVYRD